MHVLANGKQVCDLMLTLPLTGVWQATASVNTGDPMSGQVTIAIADGALTFVGTAVESSVVNDRAELRIVGGAGGLRGTVVGKSYRQITAAVVAKDICAEVGETLSSACAGLDYAFAHWCRAAGSATREVKVLAEHIGASWRMRADGALWLGSESWAPTGLTGEVLITDDPKTSRRVIAADLPAIYPGETYGGKHVLSVTHQLAGATLRTTLVLA